MRLDAEEDLELTAMLAVEDAVDQPSQDLAQYRLRFDRKRKSVIRGAVLRLCSDITQHLEGIDASTLEAAKPRRPMPAETLEILHSKVEQIDVLLGSSVERPARWGDLQRHLAYGMVCDLVDIIKIDWPAISPVLETTFVDEDDPHPVAVSDLGELSLPRRTAHVSTRLAWEGLTPQDFERLVFALLDGEVGYENPEWLMHTSASDRGRDLSVMRVISDPLTGTRRERVLVQCKHWENRSIGAKEVATLREQMRLWEPPRVDVLIIASSGRFSSDAVRLIELQNQSDSALRIEMWPESHLERLLAARPALIAEFGLR
jgi:hypothetical protein